jgi:hypothetical protein
MGFYIRDRDRGYAAITKQLFSDQDNKLDVGVFSEETYENGLSLVQAATFAEFGTSKQPARSWLRAWFDDNQDLVAFWLAGELKLVAQGKQTKEQALKQVGKKCVAGIRERILKRIPPDNAKATEKKKGFNFPLIHSGRFLRAINFLVRKR